MTPRKTAPQHPKADDAPQPVAAAQPVQVKANHYETLASQPTKTDKNAPHRRALPKPTQPVASPAPARKAVAAATPSAPPVYEAVSPAYVRPKLPGGIWAEPEQMEPLRKARAQLEKDPANLDILAKVIELEFYAGITWRHGLDNCVVDKQQGKLLIEQAADRPLHELTSVQHALAYAAGSCARGDEDRFRFKDMDEAIKQYRYAYEFVKKHRLNFPYAAYSLGACLYNTVCVYTEETVTKVLVPIVKSEPIISYRTLGGEMAVGGGRITTSIEEREQRTSKTVVTNPDVAQEALRLVREAASQNFPLANAELARQLGPGHGYATASAQAGCAEGKVRAADLSTRNVEGSKLAAYWYLSARAQGVKDMDSRLENLISCGSSVGIFLGCRRAQKEGYNAADFMQRTGHLHHPMAFQIILQEYISERGRTAAGSAEREALDVEIKRLVTVCKNTKFVKTRPKKIIREGYAGLFRCPTPAEKEKLPSRADAIELGLLPEPSCFSCRRG